MRRHPLFYAYLALVSVCFFWGTTYVGIKIALESMAPPVLISTRFLLSGLIMIAGAKLFRQQLPKGREVWLGLLTGVAVLGVGNGCLAFSELLIPSGLASLFVTLSPFWMVGIEAAMGGERIRANTLGGLLVGLTGTALLVGPEVLESGGSANVLKGFLILQLGSVAWSWGSLYIRRQKTRAHPIVLGAYQQVGAGLCWIPIALLFPSPVNWNAGSVSAIAYLAVFGSIVGYSSYVYALQHLPVSLVSIYTYINPVVAVSLGWLFYREPFGWKEGAAMALIFVGVALVKAAAYRQGRRDLVQAGGPPHPVSRAESS